MLRTNRNPIVDEFDKTKPFSVIYGSSVKFVQRAVAYNAEGERMPDVSIGTVVGRPADGARVIIDGTPFGADGCEIDQPKPIRKRPSRAKPAVSDSGGGAANPLLPSDDDDKPEPVRVSSN